MGGENFKTKKAIVHILEWIVSIIVAVMISDLTCFSCGRHYIKNQFIDASAFSYFIICCFLFVMLFTKEEFEEKVGHFIRGLGAVLYIITGILLMLYLDRMDNVSGDNDSGYYRVLIGGVFALLNGLIFIVEFFIMIFKKSLLE